MAMSTMGHGTKNRSAGEDQQQFSSQSYRPGDTQKDRPSSKLEEKAQLLIKHVHV
jgi:hypothetical protein